MTRKIKFIGFLSALGLIGLFGLCGLKVGLIVLGGLMLTILPLALAIKWWLDKRSGGPPTPGGAPAKPSGSGWGWVIVILMVAHIAVLVWWWSSVKEKEAIIAHLQTEVVKAGHVTTTNKYVASWECLPGEMFEGMTESGPQRAELASSSDGAKTFNVFYSEYGSPEHTWIELTRVGTSRTWKGEWGQENPKRSGKIVLKEDDAGNLTGTMFGKNQQFIYNIEKG